MQALDTQEDLKKFAHYHLGLAHELSALTCLGNMADPDHLEKVRASIKQASEDLGRYVRSGLKPKWMEEQPKPPAYRLSYLMKRNRYFMTDVRHDLSDMGFERNVRERTQHVEGLLTCGIVAEAQLVEEFTKWELNMDDAERGPHFKFGMRGIGADVVPCCFVCGKKQSLYSNIAAFVQSREVGQAVVALFDVEADGAEAPDHRARLDFRQHEPNWIQVKIGSCDEHKDNLEKLATMTSIYGVIRARDIADARNNVLFDYTLKPAEKPKIA